MWNSTSSTGAPELLVLADDRTGALETAGVCADAGLGPVPVVVGPPTPGGSAVVVVDMGTRHLDPLSAAQRFTGVDVAGVNLATVRSVAHKIDSTLRGNWAAELLAIHRTLGHPVVLVAAFPGVGRVCRDGVVLEHGRPVGAGAVDARSGGRSSRPAEHLREAGASDVVDLPDAPSLAAWLASGASGFAVCDAESDADLEALALEWAGHPRVVFAGTARSIGAAASAMLQQREPGSNNAVPLRPPLPRPAIVVCGSLHPAARRQIKALASSTTAETVTVLSSPVPDRVPVTAEAAQTAAEALARAFHRAAAESPVATVVIIGGDTAAALLGEAPVSVGGTVTAGMPWMRLSDGRLVVTRAGGFGDDSSLVELFSARMEQ